MRYMIKGVQEQQESIIGRWHPQQLVRERNSDVRLILILILVTAILSIPYIYDQYQQFETTARVWNRHLIQYDTDTPTSYRNLIQSMDGELGVQVKNYSEIIAFDIHELPICILAITTSVIDLQRIKKSVFQQPYRNFRFIEVARDASRLQQTGFNYYQFKHLIKKECLENSVLLFASKEIAYGTLQELNRAYQTQSVWTFYSQSDDEFSIYSTYQRIFELISTNDFGLSNAHLLGSYDQANIALAIIELSAWHALKFPSRYTSNSYVSLALDKAYEHNRRPYNSLVSLRHSFPVDNQELHQWFKNYDRGRQVQVSGIFKRDILTGFEQQEMLYLPKNHSLFSSSQKWMNAKYKLEHYKEEVPLCVCVPSHNNIGEDRYQRVVLSILQQQYTNYHIIFIDDFSDDNTLLATMKFVRQQGFPDDRIVYLQNLQQNYATYNIINAAVNYCGNEEIQLLVDGDDELIGTQAFKLISSMYHRRDNWVVYTSFISNRYSYGSATPFTDISRAVSKDGKRIKNHFIGPIRTWSVALIKKILLKDHKRQDGTWLNTLYDEAIQQPLLQMARQKHVKYVPQVCYLYNEMYEGSDDSTPQKFNKRRALLLEILNRPVYSKVESLSFQEQNRDATNELSADYGIKYIEVTQDSIWLVYNIRRAQKSLNSKKSGSLSILNLYNPTINRINQQFTGDIIEIQKSQIHVSYLI